MAEKLGVTIEFRGATTEFEQAVKKVNNEIKVTKSEISTLNKELKLDPTNVDLLQKKMNLLSDKSKELADKVDVYEKALAQMSESDIGSDKWAELTLQMNKAKAELALVNDELKNMPTANVQALSKQLEETGNKLTKIGNTIENVGKKFLALTGTVTGLATVGIKYNAELEKQTALFTGLTGSAEEAQKVLSQIKDSAVKSPFDVQSLISANQYLMASGIEAEKSTKTIEALGNAIASTGGGNSELERMAQNLQQVQNVGKASTMDLRQFAMAGIDIWGILSESTGKSVKELQKMTITYDMLSIALLKASAEGGRYAGGMEAQADTLNGKLSKLKSTFNELLGELTEVLMPIIKQVVDYLQQWIDKLKGLDEEQKKTIVKIAGIIGAIAPLLIIIGKITSGVGGLFTKVSEILTNPQFLQFILKITNASGGLSGLLTTIATKISALINPITALIAVFALLYAKNEDFRKTVNDTAKNIKSSLVPVFNNIKKVIGTVVSSFGNLISTLKDLLTPVINALVSLFGSIIKIIGNVVSVLISFLAPAINGIISLFGNLVSAIINIVSSLVSKLQPAFEFVGKLIQLLSNYITILANNMKSYAKPAFDLMSSVVQKLINDFKQIIEWIQKLFNKLANTSFGQAFIQGINMIKESISGVIETISSVMGWLDRLINKTNTVIAQQEKVKPSSYGGGNGYTSDVFNSGGIGLTMNIQIDNNGVPIDENEINRWVDTMTDRLDLALGRRL